MSLQGPFPSQRLLNPSRLPTKLESPPTPLDESSSVILRIGGLGFVSPLRTSFRTDPYGPIGTTVGSADLFPSRMHAT